MKTIVKALLVVMGFFLVIVGIFAVVVSVLNDFTLFYKILGIIGGLAVMLMGAFMMRKGSNSIGDAISWFFALIIPW